MGKTFKIRKSRNKYKGGKRKHWREEGDEHRVFKTYKRKPKYKGLKYLEEDELNESLFN